MPHARPALEIKDLHSVTEIARLFGVDRQVVYHFSRRLRIEPARVIGRMHLFLPAQVDLIGRAISTRKSRRPIQCRRACGRSMLGCHDHAHRGDQFLDHVGVFLPLRRREALLGDLRNDVTRKREAGWSEKDLRRYIWGQLLWVVIEILKPWRWIQGGVVVWILHHISK